jgi:hypothetical protein
MSRCGFLASCCGSGDRIEADIRENITPAPLSTPLQPKWPKLPVFGGMNGVRFRDLRTPRRQQRKSTRTIALMTQAPCWCLPMLNPDHEQRGDETARSPLLED